MKNQKISKSVIAERVKPKSDSEIVVSNTVFLFLAQVSTGVLSFVLIIFLSRFLGNVGLGSYSAAMAVSVLLMQSLDFGISTFVVREIARKKECAGELISRMMGLRAVLAVLMLVIAGIILFVLNWLRFFTFETFVLMGTAIFATSLSFLAEPLRATTLAYEKHHFYAFIWVTERLVFIAFALAMLFLGKDLIAVMVGFALSAIVGLFLNWIIVWKKLTPFSFSLADVKGLILNGLPFWLSNFLMTFYSRIDTVMLSVIKGFAANGIYNAAYKITDVFTLIPVAVVGAFYPTLSRIFKNQDASQLKLLFRRAFNYLLIIAIPMGIMFTLIAQRVIQFLYKSEFGPAAGVLQILVWAELFLFLNYLMGYLLNSIDKQKLFTISTAIYAVVNVVLNLMLIPAFGYFGAASVSLATQLFQAITLYVFCSQNGYGLSLPKIVFRPLIAGVAMGLAIILLQRFHLAITIFVSALVYLAVLFAVKGVGKDDFEIVNGLIRRMRGKQSQ
jgi:O-antigen/teichoic acid export membrane protein